jgi:hypothetical protein
MDRDDDIERLFSWLQMPEVRYREFADARQMIPDTAALARAPEHALPVADPMPETDGPVAHVEPTSQKDNKRSLDAVFRRLSSARP